MPIKEADTMAGPLVLVDKESGVTIIPQPTPLTRLNYFDGKFLRASDLTAEQRYLRNLVHLSNQAGGAGVVHGYDLTLASGGAALSLGPGLAIDPAGRVLLLPDATSIGIQELIDRSRAITSAGVGATKIGDRFGDCRVVSEVPEDAARAGDLYLIVIASAEALCGQEDVFGKLCEEACATSTDRPFRVEGIVVRALPLELRTPLPMSSSVPLDRRHLRSRVASSYFQDERERVASFISGSGLRSSVWCLGADAEGGRDVPIGVLARAGSATIFLDAWTARRERMDSPPKRYWQWRMAMRPWDVFLAQILQFQCQLRDLFRNPPGGGGEDPCADTHDLIREVSETFTRVATFYREVTTRFTLQPIDPSGVFERTPVLEGGLARIDAFDKRLQAAAAALVVPSTKMLIDGGIVEVPSAGYLPVDPTAVASVNEQVRRFFGNGVDLRFCIVRPDFVAHALEEAQHMERISLLEGLDRRDRRPEVDVLVPDGEALTPAPATGVAFDAAIAFEQGRPRDPEVVVSRVMRGAAHISAPDTGKVEIYTAVNLEAADAPAEPGATSPIEIDRTIITNRRIRTPRDEELFNPVLAAAAVPPPLNSLWAAGTSSTNPFNAIAAGGLQLDLRLVVTSVVAGTTTGRALGADDVRIVGTVQFNAPQTAGAAKVVTGTFDGMLSVITTRGTAAPEQTNTRLVAEVHAGLSLANPAEPRVLVRFTSRANQLAVTLDAQWSGDPRSIRASISSTTLGEERPTARPLFSSRFLRNDEVLQPANLQHKQALRALDVLGTILRDTQFAPANAALLFPAAPAPPSDLQIRARRDWVLFHRRRTKQCQPERPVVTVPTRRYQLWHGRVANVDFFKLTVDALHSGEPFRPEGVIFQRVDVLEFGPGVPTLLTPPDAVLDDWKRVGPGQQLLYAGLASGEEAQKEGPDLAKARLTQLQNVVAQISSPVPDVQVELLDRIHPDLAVPGVDGVIVALTRLETTCATVFVTQSLDRIQSLLSNNDVATAVQASERLGEVLFKRGTADVHGDGLATVAEAWKRRGLAGRELQSFVVLREGDDTVARELATKQGETINAGLGQGRVALTRTVAADLTVGCPMIVFIQPGAIGVKRALLVYGDFDVEGGFLRVNQPTGVQNVVEFRDNEPQGNVIERFVRALGPNRPVNVVMLTTPEAPDLGTEARLKAAVTPVQRPPNFRQFSVKRSPAIREQLRLNGINPDERDDVIFYSGINLNVP